MKVPFVTCDVFTERPFAGNPLFVVPDATGLSPEQMQAIAREINYSESTFVLPARHAGHAYLQRTFVPVREIPYAGHPTVGTAVVMALLGKLELPEAPEASITIEVGFGPLRLTLLRRAGVFSRVRMEQGRPVLDPEVGGDEHRSRIAAALGLPTRSLHETLPPQVVSTGNRFLIVPLGSPEEVTRASCDLRGTLSLQSDFSALGVYLWAFDPRDGRVRARAFCPDAGVPEDPATGSAAGPLGVYLAAHRALPDGGSRVVIDQGFEMGRPSELTVEALVDGEGAPTSVLVEGSAVRMMEGTIQV